MNLSTYGSTFAIEGRSRSSCIHSELDFGSFAPLVFIDFVLIFEVDFLLLCFFLEDDEVGNRVHFVFPGLYVFYESVEINKLDPLILEFFDFGFSDFELSIVEQL